MPRYTLDYIANVDHEDLMKMSDETLLSVTSQAVSAFNNRSKRAQASKDSIYLEASHFYSWRKEKGKPLFYEKPTANMTRGELISKFKTVQYELSLKTSTISGAKEVVGDFVNQIVSKMNESKDNAIHEMQVRLQKEMNRENPDAGLIAQLQRKIEDLERAKLRISPREYKVFLQTYRKMNEVKNEAVYGGKYEMWRQMIQMVEESDDLDFTTMSPEDLAVSISSRLDTLKENEYSEEDPDLDPFSFAGSNRRY